MLPSRKGLGRHDSFMPATLNTGSDSIRFLYLNASPEWEEEGAMARSLSEAITGLYILGGIGRECRCPG